MAKARPNRSQFPRGMKGDVMYRNALKKYKESYGPPVPKPPKPEGRVNRRGRFIPSKPKPETKKEETKKEEPPKQQPRTINQSSGGNNKGGGDKPKPDKNAAYKAARDKIAKAQGKDAKASATRNAEIVGLNAFIKAHEKKKGMAKAVAAAKEKLKEKEKDAAKAKAAKSAEATSNRPFGKGGTYASSKVNTNTGMA